MKVRLVELETFRTDPARYPAYRAEMESARLSFSKKQALHNSAFAYHREREDIAAALQHFEKLYNRNFKDTRTYDTYVDYLTAYDEAYRKSTYTCFQHSLNCTIPVGSNHVLSGRVARFDLNSSGGYAVWMFDVDDESWRTALVFPLLQHHIANLIGCPDNEVSVGTYRFSTSVYDSHTFDHFSVKSALEELADLVSQLSSALSM